MKLSALQQTCNNRRNNSFRAPAPIEATVDSVFKSPGAFFWLILHGLCCLISLVLGFRFSRLVFILLFSTTSPSATTTTTTTLVHSATKTVILPINPRIDAPPSANRTASRVVVGRHGIRIRPWPHPDPVEVVRAHHLIERVQREQRLQYGIKNPRPLIVVTPTYTRTFQAPHLTGLMHSLMLLPYDLLWIVVEAGGASNHTASLLSRSALRTLHLSFPDPMPDSWPDRRRTEARMRLLALRAVRGQRLDGIIVFADDSNMHSLELFDEIQSVKWIGAVSVGILAHSGNSKPEPLSSMSTSSDSLPVPVQGPACNPAGQLVGWHTFDVDPHVEKSAKFVDGGATVRPRNLEWAGFVLNSRLVWKEAEDKPDWIADLDFLDRKGDGLESPLSLLKDASHVEPLGQCGRKVMLWWLRAEARADSKFPSGWIIDPPLEITVPAKHTPWPDAPPELPSMEKLAANDAERHPHKSRSSRPRHGSRKRKHETKVDEQVSKSSSKDTGEN